MLQSLQNSKIERVVTRHKQATAFLAATNVRLDGDPGVRISIICPGNLDLVTNVEELKSRQLAVVG